MWYRHSNLQILALVKSNKIFARPFLEPMSICLLRSFLTNLMVMRSICGLLELFSISCLIWNYPSVQAIIFRAKPSFISSQKQRNSLKIGWKFQLWKICEKDKKATSPKLYSLNRRSFLKNFRLESLATYFIFPNSLTPCVCLVFSYRLIIFKNPLQQKIWSDPN